MQNTMFFMLFVLFLCLVSAQNPTTQKAVDTADSTSTATEPIPPADETISSTESNDTIKPTTEPLEATSNEIVIPDSTTEAISDATVDVQSSTNVVPSKRGPTPVAPPCPQSLCISLSNGNYAIAGYPHDFVQCSNGIASCQSCWPQSLFFSQACNQCLYKKDDSCYTTKAWKPQSTFPCPDACPIKGPNFSGNIADNVSNGGAGNPFQYIGCWKGVTQGCVICPAGLKFNEQSNACLFDGLYQTKPS
ncbi:uncharacterized protein LOC136077008 [Hydra vulgaris]|uniref:uncharacterized protein LOC136077008 n=1 Tax=Hydra vulgaris TaxID=6087 RepID=UPI0032E9D9CA